MYPSIQLQGDGKVLSTSGTGQIRTTLPTLANGNNPKYVRIMCEEDTASIGAQGLVVKTGDSSVAAVDDEGLYISMGESVILFVAGDSHISIIRITDTGSGSTTTDDHTLYIHPVEV